MATQFGSGPLLKDACPWLRDPAERHARILRVAEINSGIAGLPPFSDEARARFAAELAAIASFPPPPLTELLPASADNSGRTPDSPAMM